MGKGRRKRRKNRADYIELVDDSTDKDSSKDPEKKRWFPPWCRLAGRVVALLLLTPLLLGFLVLAVVAGVLTVPVMCLIPCLFPCCICLQKALVWLVKQVFKLIRWVVTGKNPYQRRYDDDDYYNDDSSSSDESDGFSDQEGAGLKTAIVRNPSYGSLSVKSSEPSNAKPTDRTSFVNQTVSAEQTEESKLGT